MAYFVRTLAAVGLSVLFGPLAPTDLNALDLPNSAILSAQKTEPASAQRFPTSVFAEKGTRFTTVPGTIEQHAYKLASTSLTTLQMLAPLQEQLEQSGFRSAFACADTVCGGFDFRFLLDLLPEPAMHVDLGDFQYYFAQHADSRATSIVTSRARTTGFIQITSITPPNGQLTPTANQASQSGQSASTTSHLPRASTSIIGQLQNGGSAALDDLIFASGSSSLADETFTSLKEIADFLAQNTSVTLALVGHTDAVGSLAANMRLSHKRADSVRNRLIRAYGVSASQLTSEGIGYLAPRATNINSQGRDKNRRVEAVVTSIP